MVPVAMRGVIIRALPMPVFFVLVVPVMPACQNADGQEQAGGEQRPEFSSHALKLDRQRAEINRFSWKVLVGVRAAPLKMATGSVE